MSIPDKLLALGLLCILVAVVVGAFEVGEPRVCRECRLTAMILGAVAVALFVGAVVLS